MKEFGAGAYPYLTAPGHPVYGYGPIGGGAGYHDILRPQDATAVVTTGAELVAALAGSGAGARIYVANDVTLQAADIPTANKVTGLHAYPGTILYGTRGLGGSQGAKIIMADKAHPSVTGPTLLNLHDGVRVTGLQFEGPDMGFLSKPSYYAYWICLWGMGGDVRVDNCAIRGWLNRAVHFEVTGWVHHCDIHHNAGQGEGYGVAVGPLCTSAEVVANLIDYQRHIIAGGGTTMASVYHVYYNDFGEHCFGTTHQIDVHGGNDPQLTRYRSQGDCVFSGNTITIASLVPQDTKNNFLKFSVGWRVYTSDPSNYGPFTIVDRTANTLTVAEQLVPGTPTDVTGPDNFVDFFSPDIHAGSEIDVAYNNIRTVDDTQAVFGIRGIPEKSFRVHHNWIRQSHFPMEVMIKQSAAKIGGQTPNPWRTGTTEQVAAAHIAADYSTDEGAENPNWISGTEPPDLDIYGMVSITTVPQQPNGVGCYLDDGSGPVFVGSTVTMNPLEVQVEAGRDYKLTFDDITGYANPGELVINVPVGQTLAITGEYLKVDTGTLVITVQGAPGSVLVDGKLKGQGEGVHNITVPVGPHIVSFTPPSGYSATPDHWDITVTKGGVYPYAVTFVLSGALLVISVAGLPAGETSTIKLNGQTIGEAIPGSPLTYAVESGGPYEIEFEAKPGFVTPSVAVFDSVSPGQTYTASWVYASSGGGGGGTIPPGNMLKYAGAGLVALIALAYLSSRGRKG